MYTCLTSIYATEGVSKVTVTIRLTKSEEDRLAALSSRTGRTKSFYVRAAVREYLETLEDVYAADEAVRELREGDRGARPLDELITELGFTEIELIGAQAANEAADN